MDGQMDGKGHSRGEMESTTSAMCATLTVLGKQRVYSGRGKANVLNMCNTAPRKVAQRFGIHCRDCRHALTFHT